MKVALGAWLLVALVGGALFRLDRLRDEAIVRGDGAIRYAPIARNLVMGNGFSSDAEPPYRPQAFELPGYPFFLASILALSGSSVRFVMVAQLMLEVLTVVLVGAVAGRLISARARLPSICLMAGCVFLPSIATEIATETLSVHLSTCLFACLLLASRTPTPFLWGVSGMLAGLAILTRVDAILFVLFGVPAALTLGRRLRHVVPTAGLFVGCLLLTILPWWIRDYVVLGRATPPAVGQFSYSHVGAGYRAWMNTWVDTGTDLEHYVWGDETAFPRNRLTDPSERKMAEALRARAVSEGLRPFSPEVDAGFQELARRAYRERPVYALVGAGTMRVLDSVRRVPSLTKADRGVNPVRLFSYGHWIAVLAVALWGCLLNPPRSVLWLGIALIASRLGIPFASAWGLETRYLYQAVPALVLLGSVALCRLRGTPSDH